MTWRGHDASSSRGGKHTTLIVSVVTNLDFIVDRDSTVLHTAEVDGQELTSILGTNLQFVVLHFDHAAVHTVSVDRVFQQLLARAMLQTWDRAEHVKGSV